MGGGGGGGGSRLASVGRPGPLISLWSRQRLLHAAAESQTVDTDPRSNQGEGALLGFVDAREVVGSCTSPNQWAILQHRGGRIPCKQQSGHECPAP